MASSIATYLWYVCQLNFVFFFTDYFRPSRRHGVCTKRKNDPYLLFSSSCICPIWEPSWAGETTWNRSTNRMGHNLNPSHHLWNWLRRLLSINFGSLLRFSLVLWFLLLFFVIQTCILGGDFVLNPLFDLRLCFHGDVLYTRLFIPSLDRAPLVRERKVSLEFSQPPGIIPMSVPEFTATYNQTTKQLCSLTQPMCSSTQTTALWFDCFPKCPAATLRLDKKMVWTRKRTMNRYPTISSQTRRKVCIGMHRLSCDKAVHSPWKLIGSASWLRMYCCASEPRWPTSSTFLSLRMCWTDDSKCPFRFQSASREILIDFLRTLGGTSP